MGWEKFKEELIANNPEVDSQLNRVGLVMARYEATVSKKGALESLVLIEAAPLNGSCNPYLTLALREAQWRPGINENENEKSKFFFLFRLTRRNSTLDSIANLWAAKRDSLQDRIRDSLMKFPEAKGYSVPGTQPSYLGSDQAFIEHVHQHFQFPYRCQELGINGYVNLKFLINSYGDLLDCRVVDSSAGCPEFSKEAIRVVSISSPWIPFVFDGHYISEYRQIPIKISIE